VALTRRVAWHHDARLAWGDATVFELADTDRKPSNQSAIRLRVAVPTSMYRFCRPPASLPRKIQIR